MNLSQILAKLNYDGSGKETLIEHTNEVIKYWLQLKHIYFNTITDKNFWYWSFIAILFHDFGKIAINFQVNLPSGKRNLPHIRHEFVSGVFLLLMKSDTYKFPIESIAAVFSHHKKLNGDLFIEDSKKKIQINRNVLIEFLEYSKKVLTDNRIRTIVVEEKIIDAFLKSTSQNFFECYNACFLEKLSTYNNQNTEKRRNTYIYYKAILQSSDWCASAHKQLSKPFSYNENIFKCAVKTKLFREDKLDLEKPFVWREFQDKSLLNKDTVVAVAPTGSGKTEAALLWASNKSANEKIIYCLPTRVTSNAIYSRLCEYFGNDKVAVIHSSAFYFRKELDDNFDKKKYLADKTFFKNINVCTIDQILTIGFNLGFWELKTFHLQNARIIIDEIHLYSPYTLGLIISTIKYLKDYFNVKFYIMTATMPEYLKNIICETLGKSNDDILADGTYLNQSRNMYFVIDKSIDDLYEKIKEKLKGKKVLIVVNTVDQAIKTFQALKEFADEAICYHSRYIQKHRIEKEAKVLRLDKDCKSLLLVATQVVEVSLDIDFDILYTENAPIDAIMQRSGRVNRKRREKKGEVHVFKHSENSVKIYDVPNLLEVTFQKLSAFDSKEMTEKEISEIVNDVYEEINLIESCFFKNKYKSGLNRHFEIQSKRDFIKDSIYDDKDEEEIFTREGLDTVNVIPDIYQEELSNEGIIEKVKHEVSIRRKWLRSLKKTTDVKHSWFIYVDVNYNDEIGLTFKRKEAEIIPHTLNL